MEIIVNADDFGISADTVRATIAAIDAGYVTSATLMPAAPASDQAVAFARTRADVSFGVHLTFVGDGAEYALAPPAQVAHLVNRAGRLHGTNRIRLLAALDRISVQQIEREIAAQVDWVRSQGIDVSHVDSHRHLHKYGPFREALGRALPGLGIRRVRSVQDVYLRRPLLSPTIVLGRKWQSDLRSRFTTTDHFYMPASTGDTSWTAVLELPLPGGTLEVGVHPGELEDWRRAEAAGAVEFARAVAAAGHRLVPWTEI
jgi:predicted glycoside hydrolase/deacetylase ChbG (UPF0249 family)